MRQFWVRRDRLQAALIKSNVAMPEEVSFHRALTALEIGHPNLGILLGALESKGVGSSIPELKRLTNKLLDAHLMESNEEILHDESTLGEDYDADSGEETRRWPIARRWSSS